MLVRARSYTLFIVLAVLSRALFLRLPPGVLEDDFLPFLSFSSSWMLCRRFNSASMLTSKWYKCINAIWPAADKTRATIRGCDLLLVAGAFGNGSSSSSPSVQQQRKNLIKWKDFIIRIKYKCGEDGFQAMVITKNILPTSFGTCRLN